MNPAKLLYSVPLAEERHWCRVQSRQRAWQRRSAPGNSAAVGYLFSAQDCLSIPLWIKSDDPAHIPKLVTLEIERLTGDILEPDSRSLILRKITRQDGNVLVHATVIGDPPGTELKRNWQRFHPYPLFLDGDGRAVHLWQEQGRWVAGFFFGHAMTHWHAFGPGDFSVDQVVELHCLLKDLISRSICSTPNQLVVYGETRFPDSISDAIGDTVALPVIYRDSPSLCQPLPALDAKVRPASLIVHQLQQQSRRQTGLLITFVVTLVLVACFIAWHQLQLEKQSLEVMRSRVVQLSPQADRVRQARDRWEALGPAFEAERFPVEIFHQVAVLLPSKGIRLSEFEIRQGKITIRGEASNVPTAIKFKADLETSESLSGYQWQVPPPQIKGDTARFAAFGIPAEQPSPLTES